MRWTKRVTAPVKKRKRGLATWRALRRGGGALFWRGGYDGVSVRDIASAANIQESSIYNHFAGKAEILETLYDEFAVLVPQTRRPSEAELDAMLDIMEPEEVLKNILFHVAQM
ncbi:MAG: helix-turn-helix domain-containing protein [Eubacteriales bacterium]